MVILGLVFAGYSVVWVKGAQIMETEIEKFVSAEQSLGRTVNYDSMKVKGYPFTLRAQIENFDWAAPGMWAWRGERLHIVTLPYDPSRIILGPRGPQTMTYDGQVYAIKAETLNIGLEENAYSAEAQQLTAEGNGAGMTLDDMRVNWHAEEDGSWIVGAAVRGLMVSPKDTPSVTLPFWNVAASGTDMAGSPVTVDATEFAVSNGATSTPSLIKMKGTIGVDRAGYPEGDINIGVRNPAALAQTAVDQGALTRQAADTATTMATAMGQDGEATLPLQMANGKLLFSNLPVADLPKLR